MRTLLIVVALLVSQAYAEELQFTANGTFSSDAAQGVPTFWNESFPQPTTFSLTFDVNTLDPGNSSSYSFAPGPDGPVISKIAADLVATNIVLSLDGNVVLSEATGGFGFSGENLGGKGGAFIANGGAGLGSDGAVFTFFANFGLGEYEQTVLEASSDPLALILNGSVFGSDSQDPSLFNYDSSQLGATILIKSDGVVSVPEPAPIALFALAGLFFISRGLRRELAVS